MQIYQEIKEIKQEIKQETRNQANKSEIQEKTRKNKKGSAPEPELQHVEQKQATKPLYHNGNAISYIQRPPKHVLKTFLHLFTSFNQKSQIQRKKPKLQPK